MKIISFSQQGPRAICILSANGLISNVTLRQPDSSGGTLTYEVWLFIFQLTADELAKCSTKGLIFAEMWNRWSNFLLYPINGLTYSLCSIKDLHTCTFNTVYILSRWHAMVRKIINYHDLCTCYANPN